MLVFMGTYTYMEVLQEIVDLSETTEVITLTTLAKNLKISQAALRHHIKKLDKKNLIYFDIHPYDNRAKLIKVTTDGATELKHYTTFYGPNTKTPRKITRERVVKNLEEVGLKLVSAGDDD